MGDLNEKYNAMALSGKPFRARINYWYQVFNYLRPFAMRKSTPSIFYHGMLANYSKIAMRNLGKQKLYAMLNIGGLSVGITAFLMIALFVQYEFSYDRSLPNAQRVYRIYQKQAGNMYYGSEFYAVTPIQLAGVLRDDYPEIEYATTAHLAQSLMQVNDKTFWESGITADEYFLKVFPFEAIAGNLANALNDVQSIVLTENLALKIFGDEDPLGKIITIDNESTRMVTAIVKAPPENSTFRFEYILNIRGNSFHAGELAKAKWVNNSYHTFFTLREGSDLLELEQKFPSMIARYHDPESYKNYPFKDTYYSQPMADMHLATGINFDLGVKGSRTYIFVFGAIGVLVLLLACINYMNLAIARSIHRSKEVGLRKVAGAVKTQLVFQFLGESVFISMIALLCAIGLTYLLLPFFGSLIERSIAMDLSTNYFLIPGLFIVALMVGLFAGSYPALVLSSLKPALVIKGSVGGMTSQFSLQRVLTVLQFSVSIVLVTGSVVIYWQMQFVKTKDLGFDKEHVLVVNNIDRGLKKHFETLRQQWLQNPRIVAATLTEHLPSNITSTTVINDEDADKSNDLVIYHSRITPDYFTVFGIKLLKGRIFMAGSRSEYDSKVILNESAVEALGWKAAEAVGKTFNNDDQQFTVIGIVKDFNLHNLHLPVEPAMFTLYEDDWGTFALKIAPDHVDETIAFVEKTIKPHTNYPISFEFLEDSFNQMYKEDIRIGQTFGFFTALSLIIAALGLFGLAAFVSGQRTREIGIRKVLGASVGSIVYLLSADFLKLVLIAFVISVPLAWYAMDRWLEDFAYRIQLQWWMFAVSGLLALLVAKIAIGYQSLKASLSNPVKAIRSI